MPDTKAMRPHDRKPDGLREVLEILEEGVIELAGHEIRQANGAFAGLVGLEQDAVAGRRAADFFADPDGHPLGVEDLVRATRLRDAGGSLRPVSVRLVSASRVVVADRAREQRLEQEVWQLASGHVPGSPPLCDEASGMVEHEIRTASTVVRGYLRMLLDGSAGRLSGKQREFLGEALRETQRIENLVDDLLEFAALDSRRELRVALKPARLHPVIHQAVACAHPLLAKREISVRLDLALEDDAVHLDTDRLERVLLNVLMNAARHSPPRGTIRVATHLVEDSDGASISISILDEGPGVAHEDAQRIFEPFVRGPDMVGTDGVGLGLALCRRILHAHGGEIVAVPGLGYGLFRLTLPVEV